LSLRAWRLVNQRFARIAFDGEGARLYGGRWNSNGVAVVYTAQSQSLAALELLANADSASLLERYVFISVEFSSHLVQKVDFSSMPQNWQADPAPQESKDIGDTWVASGSSCVLQVPSVIVPAESNFLLNPRHVDYRKLRIGKPLRFRFDPRLLSRK
jgi:RES domain-containing protein